MARVLAQWEVDFEAGKADIPVSVWRRERRLRSAGADSGTRLGHGWRRSSADEQLLSFVSRFSVVSQRQATRFFYGGVRNTARQRVQKMIEAGLLERGHDLTWAGPVLWPTLEGQRVGLGSGHPMVSAFRPPESQMLHRLLVNERVAELMSAGLEVFSEREIRLFENRGAQEFGHWLEDRGVKRSTPDGLSPGVLPTVYDEQVSGEWMRRERWLACPNSAVGRKTLRYPDAVYVTPQGELGAVEVELAAKETPRMAAIIEAYRDRGPKFVSGTKRLEDGSTVPVDRISRRQFRFIDWYGTPPVLRTLRGHPNSVHPLTQAPSPGLIRDIYGAGTSDVVGRTSTMYTERARRKGTDEWFDKPCEWDASGIIKGRPMSARPIPLPNDPLLAWRLVQQCLPDSYKFDASLWEHWSNLWRSDLAERGRTEQEISFTSWLMLDENHARCRELGARRRVISR